MNLQPIALPPAVSTHNRPKAAATITALQHEPQKVSTHNRPKAAAWTFSVTDNLLFSFQHTTARRRLLACGMTAYLMDVVSTHNRPKAAAPYIKKQEKSVY